MDEGRARRAALFPLIWKVSGQLVVYSPALMFSTRRDEEAHLMLPCCDMLWRSGLPGDEEGTLMVPPISIRDMRRMDML